MSSELQNVLLYLSAFFMVFLSFVVFSLCLRVLLWIYMQYYNRLRNDNRSDVGDEHLPGRRNPLRLESDRQGNIFTIANETSNNSGSHRYNDFFYVEPNADDAARIRAQLEKDEKDLPTYEEVMAMSAAQAAAGSLGPQHGASNISIATTDTTIPPYTEVELSGMRSVQPTNTCSIASTPIALQHGDAQAWPTGNTMTGAGAASTSRAAAAAGVSTQATVTIANSVSNTSV